MLLKVIFYLIIFTFGTLFGNIATLVIYRLPINKDLTKEKSICPKCKHALSLIDVIPIWSYIFLGGKCRYCKEKISPKYIIIEVLSGVLAVLLYLSLQVPIKDVNVAIMINFFYLLMYMTTFIIIAVLDKEQKVIYRQVILFGTLITTGYLFYMFIVGNVGSSLTYRYSAYIFAIIFLYAINSKKDNYIIDIILLIEYMQLFFTTEDTIITFIVTIFVTLLAIAWERNKPIDKSNILLEEDKTKIELSIAYYMGISNIIVLIIQVGVLYWFRL